MIQLFYPGEQDVIIEASLKYDKERKPIPHHKCDFLIFRSTVDGTFTLYNHTSPFFENIFYYLDRMPNEVLSQRLFVYQRTMILWFT